MAIGDWRLAVGCWRLADGDWLYLFQVIDPFPSNREELRCKHYFVYFSGSTNPTLSAHQNIFTT